MDVHVLYELLEKYQAGKCTDEELERLDKWFASLGGERPDHLWKEGGEAASRLTQEKLQELKRRLNITPAPVISISRWKKARRWVAMIAGAALLSGSLYYLLQPESRQQQLVKSHRRPVHHNRHITLPDGSTVVLHADSRLEYPAAFNKSTREVTLVGEAYFDIKRDTVKPFIIHSGRLRTTVLGTAFNIKAYKDAPEITVSVTRGKVKVETEDDRKLLAVLTPDQQVVYSMKDAAAQQQRVVAIVQTNWTQQDMVFENESFGEIIGVLEARYGTKIVFDNPALTECLIRASFSGKETLDEVLSVLCTVRNATYHTDKDHRIIIQGEGCK